jgi:hypothetical protein
MISTHRVRQCLRALYSKTRTSKHCIVSCAAGAVYTTILAIPPTVRNICIYVHNRVLIFILCALEQVKPFTFSHTTLLQHTRCQVPVSLQAPVALPRNFTIGGNRISLAFSHRKPTENSAKPYKKQQQQQAVDMTCLEFVGRDWNMADSDGTHAKLRVTLQKSPINSKS